MDRYVSFLLILLAILGTLSALLVFPLAQYVLAAALLAFVLYPVHERLAYRTLSVGQLGVTISPRISAFVVTMFGLVAAVVPLLVLSIVLLQTVLRFLEDLEDAAIVESIRERFFELGIEPSLLAELEEHFQSRVEELLEPGVELVLDELVNLIFTSLRVGVGLLVLIFLLYYFLLDGRRLLAWITEMSPMDDEVRRELFEEFDTVTWAVMKSHVFVAVIEGVLGGIGLYLVGVPNVAFWTIVMIVVSFLPAIGVWLVWGPAVGYLLFVGEPVSGLLLLAYGLAVLSVVDNYLRAILVDIDSGVHPAIVLVGVLGGIYLFGILGLFLGPVLLAMFKVTIEVFSDVYLTEGTDDTTTG